ncbi:hypothetical protein [Agreia sp. VKM Ac-1783]|uniref:NACHT domain-containing protein n=1 Tax=Agreia sp. VKM Ac-1783 TaxID=1938889 RepID=UPI00111DB956|nr:hypothetical protein [Agreia sp. VKM Ac-1783]
MDYNFAALGSRGFEHLVQALALDSLGSAIGVFGDGPDGGREATFRGRIKLPDNAGKQTWDGYGVVQVKHPVREGSPGVNAQWLIREIRKELNAFLPGKNGTVKRRHKPEYYLIATSARLSSVEDTGGIDLVNAELSKYAAKLKLKGVYVWHYDQIARLLDARPGIRQTYAGAVTSGDLISALLEVFASSVVDVGKKITINAALELRNRQWVRLGDSGLNDEMKLSLDSVAVDVPALIADPRNERGDWSEVKVIAHSLVVGSESKRKSQRGADSQNMVIIGGPGQGKSTVAQIICQTYRTAILEHSSALSREQLRLVAANKAAVARVGLELPGYRRWPIYVELSKFGDALAADPSLSLMNYLTALVRADSGPFLPSQLLVWRRAWPWLVVLDGLDEVPSAQVRTDMIRAIDEFLTEVDFNDDDVMVIATTRPQGYQGEFGEFDPEQLELRPLTATEAQRYGELVVRARLYDDPARRTIVNARLRDAASDSVTVRLMTSPLQVTILSTLLERLLRVPDTRHALFDEYYKSIYLRESSKAGRLGDLLSSHQGVIDYVHEQVGLYLHAKSEVSGQADATLSEDRLTELFKERLREEGYVEEAQLERLTKDLVTAARNRVVLIVGIRKDMVGFEVRSIQEYMAARAITSGHDDDVVDRLAVLGPSAHWRNAWLLAVGRMFSESLHQRASLLERVRQLDNGDLASMSIGVGQRLSLDMLEDDLALQMPLYRRSLLSHAIQALDRWPSPQLRRLADVLARELDRDKESAAIVRNALSSAFASDGAKKASAVLILRSWEKGTGTPTALSNRLLLASKDWRPNGHPKRRRVTVREVIEPLLPKEDLSDHQAAQLDVILEHMGSQRVPYDLTASEIATYSKNLQLPAAAELAVGVSDDDVRGMLAYAVSLVEPPGATAAIYLAQLLATSLERQRRGAEPVIVAAGRGLS